MGANPFAEGYEHKLRMEQFFYIMVRAEMQVSIIQVEHRIPQYSNPSKSFCQNTYCLEILSPCN